MKPTLNFLDIAWHGSVHPPQGRPFSCQTSQNVRSAGVWASLKLVSLLELLNAGYAAPTPIPGLAILALCPRVSPSTLNIKAFRAEKKAAFSHCL